MSAIATMGRKTGAVDLRLTPSAEADRSPFIVLGPTWNYSQWLWPVVHEGV
jgi:hypothetical protein